MDIQMTDFENMCLIVTVGLLTNVINHFNLNLVLPITLQDENMKRAHLRDAILEQKFWFNANFVAVEEYWENQLQKTDYKRSCFEG